ncbi:hypothetical protein [Micromonospora zamorensis]|uniref:hypothetical protein n=1 Tax=Micromonospora zamorensis TaxID=709883 RepID=UPI003CF56A6E
MPLLRLHLDSDQNTARRVLRLHQEGRNHHESREAAREQVWHQGHTPAGDPVFVGITNGRLNVQLLYDVQVYPGTAS